MKDTTMKWILSVLLVLFSWSLVLALQAIHVEDPAEQEQQQPPQNHNPTQSNTTFFLSVIPVQEPIRDDIPPPLSAQASPSSSPNNSQGSDKSQSGPTTSRSVTPVTQSHIYKEDDSDTRRGADDDDAQKTAHDHFSTFRSITAASSLVVDNDSRNNHQQQHQQESEFHREKEFVPSPQLGQWSDEHDFKRLLTENENVFYPMRPQPASIKSTSFIGSSGSDLSEYDNSKFINELPAPKFHSTGGNHLSQASLPLSALSKHYPKFNDFIRTSGGHQNQAHPNNGPPSDIPTYVQREGPEQSFHYPSNHRTAHFDHPYPRPDIRVQPLNGNTLPASPEPKHSSHRSTDFSHSPKHPYTFDYGHAESSQPATKPSLEFYDLNEYEKFPPLEPPETHLHLREHHHHHLHHHGPRHGPGGPWKKIVNVLAAAIPLGLVISALTPHVVFVNPNDTSIESIKKQPSMLLKPYLPPPLPHPSFITYYPRWRALVENAAGKENLEVLVKDNSSLTEFFTEISNSLTEFSGVELCEDRAFCEVARMGSVHGAKEHHKLLWKIANETTESQIRKAGMKHIFRAIREGRCEKIRCKAS